MFVARTFGCIGRPEKRAIISAPARTPSTVRRSASAPAQKMIRENQAVSAATSWFRHRRHRPEILSLCARPFAKSDDRHHLMPVYRWKSKCSARPVFGEIIHTRRRWRIRRHLPPLGPHMTEVIVPINSKRCRARTFYLRTIPSRRRTWGGPKSRGRTICPFDEGSWEPGVDDNAEPASANIVK